MWVVNKEEAVIRRWFKDGTEVTTGSATAAFLRNNAGTIEYLDNTGTSPTWGTTRVEHSMTFSANTGWVYRIRVPSSADGFTVTAEATHSDADLHPLPESHYVTKSDVDDVANVVGASPGGALGFG